MKGFLILVSCFLLVSCSQEESDTLPASSEEPRKSSESTVEPEKKQDTAKPTPDPEKTTKPVTENIVLIQRIWISCLDEGWLFFPDIYKDHEVTCDTGTPVCGRRAGADPQSEPKPYCVIGDPSKKEKAKLTMVPTIVASPYCEERFPRASSTERNKIICLKHKGDGGQWQYK